MTADDRAPVTGRHPGVGGQVEAGPAPFALDEARAEHDRAALGDLISDKHLGHPVEVALFRGAELVSSGEFHGSGGYLPARARGTCFTARRPPLGAYGAL